MGKMKQFLTIRQLQRFAKIKMKPSFERSQKHHDINKNKLKPIQTMLVEICEKTFFKNELLQKKEFDI